MSVTELLDDDNDNDDTTVPEVDGPVVAGVVTSCGSNNNTNNNNNNGGGGDCRSSSSTGKDDNTGSHRSLVSTKYGNGWLLQQQEPRLEGPIINMVQVQLWNGARLYAPLDSVTIISSRHNDNDNENDKDDNDRENLDASRKSSSSTCHHDNDNDPSVMELNVAYESLETMRKLNLEMTCQEHFIPFTPQDLQTTCAVCLLAREPFPVRSSNSSNGEAPDAVPVPPPPKRSLFAASSSRQRNSATSPPKQNSIRQYHEIAKKYHRQAKVSPPCLICGTPTCPKHASVSFRQEGINMCGTCESLFGLSYVTQILTCPDPQLRRRSLDQMIELYDRTVLLLRFMTTNQFDEVCTVLQQSTIRKNKVGIGSSSAGIVSGVLGIVSAVTIFTPIGPPLLLASLVFGGSATAAQTGSHIRNSVVCSEPHRIADRIIALHGICWNILRVTGTLRDALLLDHLRTDLYTVDDSGQGVQHIMLTGSSQLSRSPISDYYQAHQSELLTRAGSIGTVGVAGLAAASMEIGAVTAAESGVVAARGATFFSRGGTAAAALNALQFARFAGASLAAATLLYEAHNLKNTIQAIQSGNPCEKVEVIQRIRDQVRDIPPTQAVDAECERYLQALTRRQRVLTEQEVTNLLMETNEIMQEVKEITTQPSHRSENDENDDSNSDALATSERSRESIRRRLVDYQYQSSISSSFQDDDQDTTTGTSSPSRPVLSLRERIQLHKRQEQRSNSPSTIRECNNEFDDEARHAENLIC